MYENIRVPPPPENRLSYLLYLLATRGVFAQGAHHPVVDILLMCASIAQLVERPLSEREVVGSNPAYAPYQRCKNGTSSSLADARIKRDCAREIKTGKY